MGPTHIFTISLLLVAAGASASASNHGRVLIGFNEASGNSSFHCSSSGLCLPCLYSEKNDEKYRCSETGYRVPLKCIEIQDGSKEETKDNIQRKPSTPNAKEVKSKQKQLLSTVTKEVSADPSMSKDERQSYITYRSCVPADGEEKLSILGFEVIMVCLLLISGPIMYIRRKNTAIMPGAVRIPTNSPRF